MQWLMSENYLEESLSQQVAAFMQLSTDPEPQGSDPVNCRPLTYAERSVAEKDSSIEVSQEERELNWKRVFVAFVCQSLCKESF